MTITYRGVKEEALTYAEVDENFRDLLEDTTIDRVLGNDNTTTKTITVGSAIVAGANVTLSFQGSNNWTNTSIAALNAYSSAALSDSANATNSYAAQIGGAANNFSNTKLSNTSVTLDGGLKVQSLHMLNNVTIATAATAGNTGQFSWDGNYLYICVAPNQWKRTQLLSW